MAKPKRICSVPNCGKFCCGHGYCRAHYRRWIKYGDPLAGGAYKGSVPAWCAAHVGYASDSCLKWPFNREHGKQGIIRVAGHGIIASRYMCMLAHGNPPGPRHEAAHSCGKGHEGCVNPRHLRWALPVENCADMIEHGTRAYGQKNPMHRLTEEEVLTIRELSETMTQRAIAAMFGVAQPTISNIVTRYRWRHV